VWDTKKVIPGSDSRFAWALVAVYWGLALRAGIARWDNSTIWHHRPLLDPASHHHPLLDLASHNHPMLDLIVRGATLITDQHQFQADVGVQAGRIVALGLDLNEPAKHELDASGLQLFPGVIDIHVHFNEPGHSDWEGIASGSRALAAGGGTLFCDMPLNSIPCVLDGHSFNAKLDLMRAKSRTDFALWGGLVPGNLEQLPVMAELGAVGFKAFMSNSGLAEFAAVDDDTLYQGMLLAGELDLPVAVHAENDGITAGEGLRQREGGKNDYLTHQASRPVVAELEAVGRAITLAQAAGCRLHIVHVSSDAVVQHIKRLAQNDPRISLETCPHYFFFSQADQDALGVQLKCAPPIRDEHDRPRIGRQDRQFDLIASDHSPAPPSMKNDQDFLGSWGGIAGVQSTLSALLSISLIAPPHWHLHKPEISRLLGSGPAKVLRLPNKGKLELGYDADFVLVDPNQRWQLQAKDLHYQHQHSPYVGKHFIGRLKYTILRGQVLMQDGVIDDQVRGQFVRPKRRV
jgi:allantoinase